jgi:hypothetical protein
MISSIAVWVRCLYLSRTVQFKKKIQTPDTQIDIPRNSTCTKWLDLTDLLSNDRDITGPEGEDFHEEFVEAVTEAQKTLETVGLSCRWMIAAKNSLEMELQLQALPTRGSVLNKTPALSKERTASTILAR